MKDREHRWIHAPETGQNAPSAIPARDLAAAQRAKVIELGLVIHVDSTCPAYHPGDATTKARDLVICKVCNPDPDASDERARELAHADEVLTGAGFAQMFPGEALSDRIERLKDEFGERADGDEIERLTVELASLQSVADAWKALAFATRRTSTWDGCQRDAVAAERALATLRALGIDPEVPPC